MIPVARPCLGEEELEEVRKVFESGWLGMGAWVKKFEDELKDFFNVKHVIAVNTGTSAIHLALVSCGIKQGDEVIVPSLTFAATIQAIVATGASVVFCDVQPDTLNLDPEDVKKRVSSKTKAIVPVHYRGYPCEMDQLKNIAKQHRLRIIEDAAHAFGSKYRGKKIGSFGDVTCFSFDPIKIITCGEGGAIVTNDDDVAIAAEKGRILGINKDTWSRYKHERSWFYDVETIGFRYHMSNINAAIGIVQMKKFPRFLERRLEIVKLYDENLKNINGIKLLKTDYRSMAPFCYIIRAEQRDNLMAYLKKNDIDSGIHYIPNHLQSFFSKYKTSLPITEKIWNEILTLPLYYGLQNEQVLMICDRIKNFYS
ncbi:MAG TPA: DegT/DnrJ/EryC1/StrS family aminotransferase [bacterium]|nr:DegT/DnrJ/EryC1/StrS family aminotransferase [bacterium]HPP08871.1 DegT/DnrJ/EryC1/StrS family aminotransferase [bacterium]